MQVTKRDGRVAVFDRQKIVDAVLKAFKDVDGELSPSAIDKAHEIARYVESVGTDLIDVEDIQNMVETKLMNSSRKDVAKQYIIYRNDRNRVRRNKSALMKAIHKSIAASDVQNQNANVDERSFGGRMGAVNSEVMKDIALNELMSESARDNHINNMVYTHDLDHYAIGDHNCLSIPFDDLLANGFNTRQTDVRPANSLSTAMQLVAVIFQLQSLQQFGKNTLPNLNLVNL